MTFSVVVPVYNVAPYLRACLDSLLAQTYADWECICVDDGSTDGSSEVLDLYGTMDSRFKIIHKCNEGVSVARNLGIKLSRGDCIGFLDPDDCIVADWLEYVESCFATTNADIVRMQYTEWRGEDFDVLKTKMGFQAPMRACECFEDAEARRWCWSTFFYGGWSWIVFAKRNMFDPWSELYPNGMRIREDNIAMLRMSRQVNKVVQGNYPGYLYRWRESSAWRKTHTGNDTARFFEECAVLWRESSAKIDEEGWLEPARIALSKAIAKEWLFWDWHGRYSNSPAIWRIVLALGELLKSGAVVRHEFGSREKGLLWILSATHGAIFVVLYYHMQSVYRKLRYG